MKWIKQGLLFTSEHFPAWGNHAALQPTPLKLDDHTVRVFCGLRDDAGISRIGYADVAVSGNTLQVVGVSDQPVLDIGQPGAFDDNGVVPCAVSRTGDEIRLYYAGYQLVRRVRFIAFSGLAVSRDGGSSFERFSRTPVLERTHDEFLFRAVHSIFEDEGKWKAWYGGGSEFMEHGGRTLPVYDIRYMESPDGIRFPDKGQTVIGNEPGEHRVGRPFVVKQGGAYLMFFGASTPDVQYRLAFARSDDGVHWERMPDMGLSYAPDDFDSQMSAYPSVVALGGYTFLLYNGNEYGKMGFGYARLEGDLWS